MKALIHDDHIIWFSILAKPFLAIFCRLAIVPVVGIATWAR